MEKTVECIILRIREVKMTERLQIYRCEVCGNIVQVLIEGHGELVCCGEPMTLLSPKINENEGLEKHIPVFEQNENGELVIRVGSTPHPMIDEHYIQFIETISADRQKVCLKYLKPGMAPEIIIDTTKDNITAYEYCNIHGLWEGKND